MSVAAASGLGSRPGQSVRLFVSTRTPMEGCTTVGLKQTIIFLQRASSLELAATKIRHLHHRLPAEYTDISAFAFQAWVRRPPSFCPSGTLSASASQCHAQYRRLPSACPDRSRSNMFVIKPPSKASLSNRFVKDRSSTARPLQWLLPSGGAR